jgi:formyltetrahydrofolate synthetase
MRMSDNYINDQLSKAQALLWSGSLHEVDEAHNIVSNLIRDRIEQTNQI